MTDLPSRYGAPRMRRPDALRSAPLGGRFAVAPRFGRCVVEAQEVGVRH